MATPLETSGSLSATAETLATIHEVFNAHRYSEMAFELSSAGGSSVALDQFELQIKPHASAAYDTYISDWSSTIADKLISKTATLNTLSHGTVETAVVKIPPCYSIRFQSAQAGVTASAVTITLRGTLR